MGIPNTQWKFIIVMMDEGEIRGTNDEKVATQFALVEENFVINTSTCQVLTAEVREVPSTDDPEESDEVTVTDLTNIAEQSDFSL